MGDSRSRRGSSSRVQPTPPAAHPDVQRGSQPPRHSVPAQPWPEFDDVDDVSVTRRILPSFRTVLHTFICIHDSIFLLIIYTSFSILLESCIVLYIKYDCIRDYYPVTSTFDLQAPTYLQHQRIRLVIEGVAKKRQRTYFFPSLNKCKVYLRKERVLGKTS